MKFMDEAVEKRREQNSDDRDKNQAAEQRVTAGEDFATISI